MSLHDRDYDEARHQRINEELRGLDRNVSRWVRWNSAQTWRRVAWRTDRYCWEAFGDVVYSPREPVDAHFPVQPSAPWIARICDCGGTKAATTHALWCATQPQPFGRRA